MKNNIFIGMYMCDMIGIPTILSRKMDIGKELHIAIFCMIHMI